MNEGIKLDIHVRLERDDGIPAWGGYFQCVPPSPRNHVILLNVTALMSPNCVDDQGQPVEMSRKERKRTMVTTLMHEFGHVLERHFRLAHNEEEIEKACEAWESRFAEVEKEAKKP